MTVDHAAGFYLPWAAALAVAAAEPVAIAPIVLRLPGLDLPLIQTVLAVAGVLMARPLARKKEAALPLSHFLITSVLMIVLAVVWVAEAQPGVLFSFVVSIGLGFSGYSLIELVGKEIEAFIKRIVAQATEALKSGSRPK